MFAFRTLCFRVRRSVEPRLGWLGVRPNPALLEKQIGVTFAG